jgi:predicted permease
MAIWRRLESWLSWFPWYRRQARDADLARELRDHLDLEADEQRAAGLSPEEAAYAAHRALGNTLMIEENVRAARGFQWLETLIQDMRYGLRQLRRSPGFTAVAVLTLALGIGANTAIFSIVDFLLLRPLPIKNPAEVRFLVSEWKSGHASTAFSYPDFQEIRRQTADVFLDIAASQSFQMDGLTVDGTTESMWASYVSGNFFDVMGIKPAVGRFILPTEGQVAGADPVLVLSYAYWKSRFNGDPRIAGRKASVNGQPVTIIGVAPKDFHGPTALIDFQGYMPLAMAATFKDAPKDFLADPKQANSALIVRLMQGVTDDRVKAALSVVAKRVSDQHRKEDAWVSLRAFNLGPAGLAIDPTEPDVLSLVSVPFLTLGGFVLLLACANMTNLFLVRATIRQREMAVRAALGGARGRLIRQLLTETVLLALFGCVGGIILGLGSSRAFGSISMRTVLPVVLDFHFDWRVFAYALVVAVPAGILVGIVPALRAASCDLNEVLHEGGRTPTSGRQRLRTTLVVVQVAGSLMLLIIAGLFVRSLENVQHYDLGFDPSHVLNLTIDPHEAGYDEAQARNFFQTLLSRVRAIPGVQSASLAASVPMGYYNLAASIQIPGYETPQGQRAPYAGYNEISAGYLETMRIPLIRGRDLRHSDDQNSPRVALISQTMAERYWHGQDVLGRRFSFSFDPGHPLQVVGVVGDCRQDAISREFYPFFYVPLAQSPGTPATLQLRTTTPPEVHEREMTSLIHSLEPAMPVADVQPMAAALQTMNGFLIFQVGAVLAASLGILGLLLAIVGVYGVISYSANQRTHEIGVRMALGARPLQILQMVLRQGFAIVALGIVLGVVAAVTMAKLVANLLVNVSPVDPSTYGSASLVLASIALAACYLPARRATRVDPMVALKYE